MGITNSNKLISTDKINCTGSFKVTLALTAAPDIVSSPTDIVLVLDRSGSMAGQPIEDMKVGSKTFIEIISQATGGNGDTIGSGSTMALVSFADTAKQNTALTTSVPELNNAVNQLAAGGLTNHADAFEKAMQLLDNSSGNDKVIVLFTDGNTTIGLPPAPVAKQARERGITIYCIGLIGSSGVDVNVLENWATAPAATHVAVTPNAADLEELFAELAANISNPGATDIAIEEVISDDFRITGIAQVSKGQVQQSNATTLQWTIPSLGAVQAETAILEFFVQHTAKTAGTKKVNAKITYTDTEGNLVRFPEPEIEVECGTETQPEPCPQPKDFILSGCTDSIIVDFGDLLLQSMGRIVQLDVTVKQVCPNRRVALAIILTEETAEGMEEQRGMKAMTLPAHTQPACRDILVRCVKFVLPDDLLSEKPQGLCRERKLKVRCIANYIDTDYRCCEAAVNL